MSATKTKEEQKKLAEIENLQQSRNYTRGMKLAKQILKKNPKCAEAIAYKAFFHFMQDQAKNGPEAVEIMKSANRVDLKNPKVWKIGGGLYREMQDFPKAIQCFKFAYTYDPKDITILNELCSLNLFEGHYSQVLTDTRTMMRTSPTGYTIIRHIYALVLIGNIEGALRLFENFQNTWKTKDTPEEEEFHSECCLLRMKLLVQAKRFEECITYAKENAHLIRDVELKQELVVESMKQLGQDPMPVLLELLKVYPENGDYFDVIEEVTPKDQIIDRLIELKDSVKSHYAHVRALELMDINDPRFKPLLTEHLKPLLMKGAPATYMTVRDMSQEKLLVALEIAKSIDVPIVYVPIVHLFAAHVYGYGGNIDKAIEELDAGLKHTATCTELIAWKARFYARAGKVGQAIEWAQRMREADPADRNYNLLLVKNLFLGGYREKATKEAEIFAGQDGGKELIFETQFNVFYLQNAFASLRAGEVEFAKTMYNGIFGHFDNYRKNQYSYVNWSWKRPRALLDMVAEMNRFEHCPVFSRAVEMYIQIAIMEGKKDEMKDLALRAMKCGQPAALAYSCVVFSSLNMRLQALKCFLQLKGSPYAYLAQPAMKVMMEKNANDEKVSALVREVMREEYHAIETEPQTFEELFAAARGEWALGNTKAANELLLKVVNGETLPFKKALEVYVFATCLSACEEIKTTIGGALTSKYPQFEFALECTDEYHAKIE